MSSKKKVFAVVITTAALTVGSFGAATAANKATRVSKTTKTSITTIADAAASGKLGRGAELSALLSALVTKGTITQAQADAILAAHDAADAARDAARAIAKPVVADQLKIISDAIGVDTATITTRIKAGDSLATIAGAKKDALIAALIADHTKRIDAAVTAGTITAAQATTLKSNLTTHITNLVNASPAPLFKGGKGGPMGDKGGKGGKGERGHGGRGHGGPGMGGGASGAPTIPTPAATTAATA
jgi:polyhydroxyalkanoate synthesis regulator phasin